MTRTFPVLEVVFAHHDEPISLPPLEEPENLSERQLKRCKSRRTAHFLLTQLFTKYRLDLRLLDDIRRTRSGRPFVEHPHVDFNISDSGDWTAVIFCYDPEQKTVGIDIEQPQKVRRYENLLRHYASQAEIDGLLTANHTPFENLVDRFHLSWCLHEAVLKSQGVGIVKLSEVRHFPAECYVQSAYCPEGRVHFYHQLPFYLCYFYENPAAQPMLSEWKNGGWQKITRFRPLVYQVNTKASSG